ncbi:MAG: pectate lyase [Paludibacteraceae bacterium]|nr:pectate lyase [Paludibacteraceae bacterium]
MDIRLLYLVLGISLCLASCKSGGEDDPKPASQVLAFPGADGGGKYTTGGRGGMVVHVTSLEDDINDRGSLRYALSLPGARTIVFDVSGTINLKRQLEISEGTVTIAGQTAPGDGICIAGFPVVIKTSNVIIRFLRFRMGDQNKVEGDALTINDRRNIIIDHCSFSWSTDECVSVYGNTNFTLQYCFITESLRQSVHIKGNHGYGGIWGGTNASFHHNLLAHHDSRNPRFDHDYVNSRCAGPIDYVNNVIYNWGGNSAYGGEGTNKGAGGRHINMVNNYYKYGPATSKKYRIVNPTTKCGDNCGKSPGGTVEPGKFYITGNYVDGSSAVTKDNWQGVDPDEVSKLSQCKATARWTDGLTMLDNEQTAEAAFETVLAKAGCSLHRDAVDLRIVQEVKNRGGKLVNSPDEAGGYPTLASKTAPVDTDHDGMPDEWEDANGLDKNNLSDGKIYTLDDKYTNLEVYLNSLVQDLF